MKRDSLYLYIIPIACVVLLLVFTLRLYTFAYFWNDDFNNLYWVQTQSFSQMVGYVVNPASDFFRPAGMFLYWAALQLFDRNAQAYHRLLWSLHAINVGLVYWILRRFTGSHAGAMVGAMLFSSQYLLNDLYWSFGTIFEVASAMLYFAGILLWSRERRSLKEIVLASVVFLLAIKAKEMAVYSAAWSQRSRSHSHARCCGVFRKVYPPAAACTNIVRIVRSVVLRGVRSNEGFDPISPRVAARYCRRLPCLCKRLAVDPGATAR